MKIKLEIPKEFIEEYYSNRFFESLMRIYTDVKSDENFKLSGNYEYETLEMLIKAFKESEVINGNESK